MSDFVTQAAELGWPLSEQQQEQFAYYLRQLVAWNSHTNLTAITEPAAIETRHFLDALTCASVTGDLNGRRLIDIGTGAGFPGLPLKILFPHLRLTLVDSVGKKTRFLQHVTVGLGVAGVLILTERAEVIGQDPAHREQYDWATARAVAHLRVLAEYLLPLVRVGGGMLAQKGADAPQEAAAAQAAITLLGGAAPQCQPVRRPGMEQEGYVVTAAKVTPTPERYPRRPGLPAKRPLP